jgi:hypothetical protein
MQFRAQNAASFASKVTLFAGQNLAADQGGVGAATPETSFALQILRAGIKD